MRVSDHACMALQEQPVMPVHVISCEVPLIGRSSTQCSELCGDQHWKLSLTLFYIHFHAMSTIEREACFNEITLPYARMRECRSYVSTTSV